MESTMIGMLAETPAHVGAGRASGFIDLPVARESITSYPMIPSTGLKGAFRGSFREHKNVDKLFGKEGFADNEGHAGGIVFSEAKLLLLPVRSLTSSYRWLTCPHILERLKRDLKRTTGKPEIVNNINIPTIEEGKGLGHSHGALFLEEREFSIEGTVNSNILDLLKMFIPNADVAGRLEQRLVILHDDDFKWFAQYGLQVNARNVLKKDTKASENLWYEEALPADSVFYTIIMERKEGMLNTILEKVEREPYIQLGGNETVGQGWFNIRKVGE